MRDHKVNDFINVPGYWGAYIVGAPLLLWCTPCCALTNVVHVAGYIGSGALSRGARRHACAVRVWYTDGP